MVKRLLISSLLLVSILHLIQAQQTLSGSVKNKRTKAPISNAIVFIANSTVETTTDEEGKFTLNTIPDGYNQLIISHQAHKTYAGKLRGVTSIEVLLSDDLLKKDKFETKAPKSKKWKRYYQQFEKVFLGDSENAKQSEIVNPEVLEFEKDGDGTIWGYSVSLLKVENRGIGYTIHTQLDRVEIRNRQISFTGNSFFSELPAASPEQQNNWNLQREKTYLGSRQHFLYALKSDRLEELGFDIYRAEFTETGKFETLKKLNASDVFIGGALKFDDFLRVVYRETPAEVNYRRQTASSVAVPNDGVGQIVRGGMEIRNIPESDLRVSYLFNRASKLALNDQAQMRNPEYLLDYGYWNWERMAEALPREYHLAYIASQN